MVYQDDLLFSELDQSPGFSTGAPSGYASKPDKPIVTASQLLAGTPAFVNLIRLQTENHNLHLQLGYCAPNGSPPAEIEKAFSHHVVMNSESAKQLLLALAELFQCQLRPLE
jgi:hypothetical protein